MKYLSKIAAVVATSGAVSAFAHPGHEHHGQSAFHMVTNNLVVVALIVGVLLSVRAVFNRK